MRIVYISSSLIPSQTANSVHVMKMCQAFARNGHDVVLIVRSDGQEKTLSEKDVFAYYGVDACFSIQRCWAPPLQTRILYGWGSLRKAKSLAPDLVYSRHYESAVFCARRGFKTIYECHAPPKWKNRLFDQFLRINRWDQSLCRIVVITKSLGEHIAADCMPDS